MWFVTVKCRAAETWCCVAFQNFTTIDTRGVGISFSSEEAFSGRKDKDRVVCTLKKEYVSSPLEVKDFEMSKRFQQYESSESLKLLLDYVTSKETIAASQQWLERIKIHMSSGTVPPITDDDRNYLSRFEYTRTCGDEVDSWTEWIEPITVHARHPFGFGRCRNTQTHFVKGVPRTGRSDVDYVLLQSGVTLHNQTHTRSGKRVVYSNIPSIKKKSSNSKHYMLDAGTSTFDSSLFWFTCGYSQRKISFDQVFAWEMTLLEPTDYWSRVPKQWKPFWHFYNVPIQSGLNDDDSPLRLLQQIASPNDFVSFKLDIDHPDMEMPIAMKLLSDPLVSSLVDEFFFELHFRCEVMTSCGWGKRVPAESHGLVLDRPHVLQYFIDLRKKA